MMKSKWIVLCGLVFMVMQAGAEEAAPLKTQKDMLSYGIGVSIGKNLKKEGTDVDLNLLITGLKSSLAGEHLLLSDKEWRSVLSSYQNEISLRAKVAKQQAMETNKKKSDIFLAENKAKEGVIVLPSGVQYKILKAGDGSKPTDSSMVQVNYRGTLPDGTEFDATTPDHPANLKLSALIAGWKEALKLMPIGSKWQIAIPPQLAYGERGIGSDIGPNEALIFEVELVAIN
jgi:FKBP-type peptidyl-prolyl cis-trans isomerase